MIKADAIDTAPHVWLGSSGLHLRGAFQEDTCMGCGRRELAEVMECPSLLLE